MQSANDRSIENSRGKRRVRACLAAASIAITCMLIGAVPVRSQLPPITPTDVAPLYATPTTRDGAGRVVVPVMVNGQGPFRFVLDTGANRSVLAAHMVTKLGLTLSDHTLSVELSGVTGETVVPTVKIQRVQAGALQLVNIDMPVIGPTMAGVDGVLGTEGFEGKKITIDFVRDRVLIEQSRRAHAPSGYMTIPAIFRHGRLFIVDAMVGRVKCKAVIDTGAEGTLGTERLRQLQQRYQSERRAPGPARVEGVTPDIQTGDLVQAPPIRFGDAEIGGLQIAYGKFHVFKLWGLETQSALLVGMDILGTVDTLAIDYARRELHIKPRSNILVPRMR